MNVFVEMWHGGDVEANDGPRDREAEGIWILEILVKVDSKTQAKLDEFSNSMTEAMRLEEQEKDAEIKSVLRSLFEDRSGHRGGQQNDVASWGKLLEGNAGGDVQEEGQQRGHQGVATDGDAEVARDQNGSEDRGAADVPVLGEKIRGKMIMSEIEKFRMAQEQREQEQEQKRREAILERLRREKEEEDRQKAKEEMRKAAEAKRLAADEAARLAREEKERNREEGEMDEEDDRKKDKDDDDEDDCVDDATVIATEVVTVIERSEARGSVIEVVIATENDVLALAPDLIRASVRDVAVTGAEAAADQELVVGVEAVIETESVESDVTDVTLLRSKRHRSDSKVDDTERDTSKSKKADDSIMDTAEKTVEEEAPKVMPKVVLGLKMQSATSKKDKPVVAPNVSVFTLEEEVEVKPTREIVPIDYTEDEKLAGASVQQRVAATVARINIRSGDVKSLIEQIPTETTELFSYPIDWMAVDKHKIVAAKMAPWVAKKIIEYLGEEEPTLIEFILKKLDQRAKPEEILTELQLVLDDDAEVFVKLLWRKLAFEAIRSEQLI
uniref:PWI domain-containing protein n=1 Tax=Globisporangium ultimum (strain ATCC 200006 / CBS 805.95 / DAOM BR144) TaxID=431595 RepID=K3WIU2_GLOUD